MFYTDEAASLMQSALKFISIHKKPAFKKKEDTKMRGFMGHPANHKVT